MRLLGYSFVACLMLSPALSAAQESGSVGSLPPLEEAPPPPERAEKVTPVPESSQVLVQPPPPPSGAAVPGDWSPPAPAWPAVDQPGAEQPAPDGRRWYGWQTLASDGITIGLLLTAAGSDGEAGGLATLSLATYLLAPPIIHASHDRVGVSFASLGVRVGLPLGGMMVGAASADCGGEDDEMFCGLSEAAIGFTLSALSAMVIDGAFLAWEPPPERQRDAARISISPAVKPVRGGASAGVLGVF